MDLLELRIPVRMLPPFQHLPVRLQAVPQPVQQAVHAAPAHCVTLGAQGCGQPPGTATRPAQRPRRVAPRDRIEVPYLA